MNVDNQPERLIGGRYRLHHVLGTGSMGTVWAAYDEVLRRNVAVKEVLRPPGMPEREADELRERTMREARSIAQLSHPNLVTLYDVVQVDGEPYVVMELVPSQSLGEVLKTHGRLTEQQAAAVADAVAAALEHAHRAGITHRDVKPGNVLIAEDGRVKLTDFGIARNVAEATMTSRGIALGTPAFIAPEVATGGDVSAAADRWSLGATLWAALAGEPPYEGKNVLQTINQVIHGEVPEPVGAGALAPIISGLMVKDPAGRMPLVDVRRRIYPLLPEPGTQVFSVEAPEMPLPVLHRPKPKIAPETPLASDPGPLPFMTTAPMRRRRRGPVATAFLLTAAVLLFAAGSAGGFALTRIAAGTDVLPPQQTTVQTQPSIEESPPLTPRTASAATANGEQGAQFTLNVERDWTMYAEQRAETGFPASALVHFVSPTGVYSVTVQRFPDYFPKKKIGDYVTLVRSRWPGQRYFGEVQTATELTYKTVEGDGAEALRRTRFSRVVPSGNDLWVVEVAVPTEQEEIGRAKLFDAIASTFTPSA